MRTGKQLSDNRAERVALAAAYLDELFQYSPEGLHFCIWANDPFRSGRHVNAWYEVTDIRNAAEYAIGASEELDVYTGIALFDSPKRGRGSRAEAAGFVGYVADFDYGKISNHAEVTESGIATYSQIIDSFGLNPSFGVQSGNGVHAYWLLTEPWIYPVPTRPYHHEEAHMLYMRFIRTLQEHAAKFGGKLDSTIGIERVWRIPGTINHKQDANLPVTTNTNQLISCDRFNTSDIEDKLLTAEYLGLEIAKSTRIASSKGAPVVAGFPIDKHESLRRRNQKYRQVFDRLYVVERTLAGDDSRYDAALCGLILRDEVNKWEDGEIIAVLQHHRRVHNPNDPKADRMDYYERTVAKFRALVAEELGSIDIQSREIRQERLQQPMDSVTYHLADASNAIDNAERFAALSAALGVSITDVVIYDSSEPTVTLTVNGKMISYSSRALRNWYEFSEKIELAVMRALPSRMKSANWDKIRNLLLTSARIVEAEPEETETGLRHSVIMSYLRDVPYVAANEYDDMSRGAIIIQHGVSRRLYIEAKSFTEYVISRVDRSFTRQRSISFLKTALDTKSEVVNVRIRSGLSYRVSTRSAYRVPESILRELDDTTSTASTAGGRHDQ